MKKKEELKRKKKEKKRKKQKEENILFNCEAQPFYQNEEQNRTEHFTTF